ncbi:MAG TPA: response regulator [Gammaproteobacteria bacterium]|nr:response regulator [Gammaproteobacteria bacterium]
MKNKKDTILIVEDNALVAEFTKINFTNLDCDVDIALDGKTALEYAKQKIYDLILMDLGLPDIDGYTVTQEIRSNELLHNNALTPIVALTAHITNEGQERCIASGMRAIIVKPLLQEKTKSLLNNYVWIKAQMSDSALNA